MPIEQSCDVVLGLQVPMNVLFSSLPFYPVFAILGCTAKSATDTASGSVAPTKKLPVLD
ncbi:hypothetical protein IG631_23666 [Alternaria alternata]|nr:hypothetical protein IG631_23666 [Alternaria alternata]